MWAFSGCAHYTLPGFEDWYSDKQKIKKGLSYDRGINLERLMVFLKKIAYSRASLSFVGPSSWITNLVSSSYLLGSRRAIHIVNPINTGIWKRTCAKAQRKRFNLNVDDFVILTSSMNALSDPRKGYVYFADILKRLKHKGSKRQIKFAVIGHEGEPFDIDGTPCIPLGTCFSETDLASLYCVGDIYIFPSIMDNLANTLKEATCCGLPCVAFDIGRIQI